MIEITKIVETNSGKIEGRISSGMELYLGIPYAEQPIGDLRFRPTQPVKSWNDILIAKKFSSASPQVQRDDSEIKTIGNSNGSLTLNIFKSENAKDNLPVMIWIHGGGFVFGSNALNYKTDTFLAKQGKIILVSINYRLGIQGLLYHPSLVDEETGIMGNWGFLDQIEALKWIKSNIEFFGGDPNNITIFGCSAGGASVSLQMISPYSKGLFNGVIAESGAPYPATKEQGIEATEIAFKELNIDAVDANKIRNMSDEKLIAVQEKWSEVAKQNLTACRPVQDGILIPFGPFEAIDKGLTSEISLISGSNRDEHKLFAVNSPLRENLDKEKLKNWLSSILSNDIYGSLGNYDEIINTYRKARNNREELSTNFEIGSAIWTDFMIRIPMMRFAERHQSKGNKSYAYMFTFDSVNKFLGACHALEVPFIFGNIGDESNYSKLAGNSQVAFSLSKKMQDAWISFAINKDPSTKGIGKWDIYESQNRSTMIFGREIDLKNGPREPERRILDELD